MEVPSERYDQILRETSADVRRLGFRLDGFVGIEVYGTDDKTHILLITEWIDREAWAKSQWDEEVQKIVATRFAEARFVHMKVYERVDPTAI